MAIKYNEKVIDHFLHPRNLGKLENPDAEAVVGSPACGDQVAIYLKIDPETEKIEDIKFESFGCASNIATASIITELAKGKTIDEAMKISWKKAVDELGGLPPVKYHCSILAVDGLRSAIRHYLMKQGRIKPEDLNSDLVREELYHVIYPPLGVDIVSARRVKYIGVEDGVVTIDIDFSPDDPYLEEIKHEIEEKVSVLPGVKEIIINNVGQ